MLLDLKFYDIDIHPFREDIDIDSIFLSPNHAKTLSSIASCVAERKGVVLLLGEGGLGKTALLRFFLQKVDRETLKTIHLHNPTGSFSDLVMRIAEELGLDTHKGDLPSLLHQLYHALVREFLAGRNVVLAIDEVYNMRLETLENLYRLTMLEASQVKLLQIVMISRPELEERLNLPTLRQLKQCIAVLVTMSPLSKKESIAYMQHRLVKAHAGKGPLFTKRALRCIVRCAGGIPRDLNMLCVDVLHAGLSSREKPISAATAKQAIGDFRIKGHPVMPRSTLVFIVGFLLLVGFLWHTPQNNTAQQPVENTAETPAEEVWTTPSQPGTAIEAQLAIIRLRTHQARQQEEILGQDQQRTIAERLAIVRMRVGNDTSDPIAARHDVPILKIQERLQAAGFAPGPMNGVLGSKTREALRQFQKAYGLAETGDLNAATLQALGL